MSFPQLPGIFTPSMLDFVRISQRNKGILPTQYRSNREFNEKLLYLILYASEAANDFERNRRADYRIALRQIDRIREEYASIDISTRNAKIAIPSSRANGPILVCGFFGEKAVRKVTEELQKKGYNAHVSLEGTCKYP